ncbi:MAG: CDP-alcohol phosphatidyltransferase family protein [bacterium]
MVYLYHYIPNSLTLLRMISAPFLWHAILMHETVWALVLVTFAIVSDVGDGYAARRLFVTSRAGTFLDPLADKVVVLAGFIALWQLHIVPLWVVLVIIVRDLFVTWLRTFLLRRGMPLRTSWMAKSKTALQFVSLYALIIGSGMREGLHAESGVMGCLYYLSVGVALATALSTMSYWYRLCAVLFRAGPGRE